MQVYVWSYQESLISDNQEKEKLKEKKKLKNQAQTQACMYCTFDSMQGVSDNRYHRAILSIQNYSFTWDSSRDLRLNC